MLLFGVVAYSLRKLNYPVAPAVLAIVLGPLAEAYLRQSLIASRGDPTIFVTRPISLVCILLALALVAYPIISAIRRRRRVPEGFGDGRQEWQG
jgi:putative tricarboxylic transport membrane protein